MAGPGLVKDNANLRALDSNALAKRRRTVDKVGANSGTDFCEGRLLALTLQDDDVPLTFINQSQALGLDGEVLLQSLATWRRRFDHGNLVTGALDDLGKDVGQLINVSVAIADKQHPLGLTRGGRGQRSQQEAKQGEGASHSSNPRLPHGESTPTLASIQVVTSVIPCVA